MKRAHAIAVCCFVLLSGCAQEVTWMSDVRASSEAADAAEARGDDARAIAALERIVVSDAPRAVAADDARVIRQDAHERLARLRLRGGDVEGAAREVDEGLALGAREDLFTANLHAMRGRIHEARGQDREAARAYHDALLIHEALLDRALGGE